MEIIEALERAPSLRAAAKLLGINYVTLKRRVEKLGLEWHPNQGGKGVSDSWNRKTPEIALVLNRSGRRQNPQILKRCLVEIGREFTCEECGQGPEWNGKRLHLTIDHKNGNKNDDRSENLRFLCPNCHSQTSTFAGRNAKRSPT